MRAGDSCELTSNFNQQKYHEAIQKILEHIHAGDVYQVNLSQRYQKKIENINHFELYKKLCSNSLVKFASYFNLDNKIIASASPERFLKLTNQVVTTSPIKGTMPRSTDATTDLELAQQLQTSEKNRAENIMIVDLMRNDLSRVCEPHSVKVTQLCALQSFATVHHLVSTIIGKLKLNHTAIDLLKATFPGGSITGAPKIRAMQIITELEQLTRGPYCGNLCYISFNGDMDSSILIRTLFIDENKIYFHVGGGVVADSGASAEYEETLVKARRMRVLLEE